MAKMAKRIEVERAGVVVDGRLASALKIDGEPFPWYIADDGVDLTVTRYDAPGVRLKILAETVTVVDTIGPIDADLGAPLENVPLWSIDPETAATVAVALDAVGENELAAQIRAWLVELAEGAPDAG